MLAMNKRIGIALAISVSLHAVAMAVSLAMPNVANKVANANTQSTTFSIQLVDTALPLPDAMSPLVGRGADTTSKLDGATTLTHLAPQVSDTSIEKIIDSSQIGDAANSKTKASESSAVGANGTETGLKSVLISAIQFDTNFYPEKGGKLKIRIDIDEAGIPKAVTRISHSPKNLNVDYFLDTILEARFIPAEKDGKLFANSIVVEIDLKLENDLLSQHFMKK
jgi:hypothetical protein